VAKTEEEKEAIIGSIGLEDLNLSFNYYQPEGLKAAGVGQEGSQEATVPEF